MPAPVVVSSRTLTFPTYLPAPPDRNPMFLEKRVYQGSSGRVYPLPFYDRIAEHPVPHDWEAVVIENEFLEVTILPALGGRIHRVRDKTNGYDLVYYQPVIKPALVGLAGPWVSGGIEFNWPQHHRPSTFMPAQVHIEHAPDGSATVWLGEHDPMARMRGLHGVCLHPERSYLELKARAYNRTDDVQTFLWWANVATQVHERYQSFFPPDTSYVADHAKRAMSAFPLCSDRYYGVDYGRRAREGTPASEQPTLYPPNGEAAPNDLSWYANIPVPTSYMCMGSREDFLGGYDFKARAGLVHVANHHISPGKKQWTWGNHAFGYAWDRNLTDARPDGEYPPYIELMAGVYTDNQPDFSFLQPGETKQWSQFWFPLREIGPAQHATADGALAIGSSADGLRIGVNVTARHPSARILLTDARGTVWFETTHDLAPDRPFLTTLPRRSAPTDLTITVRTADARILLQHTVRPRPESDVPPAATEPPPPEAISSADELYVTGLHLEQYRHATRCPTLYWREALRRDPGDARCNLALGRWHLRRGEFTDAERHLRASIARLTSRNPNPSDGEPHYQLGRCLRHLGQDQDAYDAFYKATWNHAWTGAAYHALAEIDCTRGDFALAADHLQRALRLNTDNLRARALLAIILGKQGRSDEARHLVDEGLARDPLDAWLRHLAGQPFLGDSQIRLDLALDHARAGLHTEALGLLSAAEPEPQSGTGPLIGYLKGWLYEKSGDARAARLARRLARTAAADYCFPARLEEAAILISALAADPKDALAHALLGHWLYDRRRHREAISHWEKAVAIQADNPVIWRCLGVAYFNILRQPAKARHAYDQALLHAPGDGRLLYERDQLWKRLRRSPASRLRALERDGALHADRDDLTVELCALYNQTDQPEKALGRLLGRRFQPWEGGEGGPLGQNARTHTLLGRQCLRNGDAQGAVTAFATALTAPTALGEARHLLANASDLHLWLGDAYAALGDQPKARAEWTLAAEFRGDFQDMSVRSYSELTYYSALALRRLGRKTECTALLRKLLAHARALAQAKATVDYFATSLPTMLLFDDDLTARQQNTARIMQAQALHALGRRQAALERLRAVLKADPAHALAADLLNAFKTEGVK